MIKLIFNGSFNNYTSFKNIEAPPRIRSSTHLKQKQTNNKTILYVDNKLQFVLLSLFKYQVYF